MKRLLLSLFAVVTLLLPAFASAQEQVSVFPTINPVNSAALNFAIVVDREPFMVGKGEFEGDRAHIVAHVPITGDTLEVVVIGNRIYLRENENERWTGDTIEIEETVGAIPNPQQALDEGLFLLFDMGDVDVNGVATRQYQLQDNPENYPEEFEPTSEFWLDLFIGKNDAFVHKLQITSRTIDPEPGGPGLLEALIVLSSFNQSFVIGAPPADLVDEVDDLGVMRFTVAGAARVLPLWARPLVARALALQQR